MRRCSLIIAFALLAVRPARACLSPAADTFAITAGSVTVSWTSACSSGTVVYAGLGLSVATSTFGFGTLFNSADFNHAALLPNTEYFARVSTDSRMAGAIVLGSTYTWARPPLAAPLVRLPGPVYVAEWLANGNPAPTTNYEAQVSTDGFVSYLYRFKTSLTSATFSGLPAGTTVQFGVRARNEAQVYTPFVLLGSTMTPPSGGVTLEFETGASTVTVMVASGTFPESFTLVASTAPEVAPVGPPETPARIADATAKLAGQYGDARRAPLAESLVEVRARSLSNGLLDANAPVAVSFTFASADQETLDGAPEVRVRTLSIYRLQESAGLWVRVPTSRVDPSARRIYAEVPALGVMTVMGALDTRVDDAFAFPVPYEPARGHVDITFVQLPQQASIRVYTAAGRWVRTLEESDGDGALAWDVRDASGSPLPSGAYYFVIKSSTDEKRGTLLVVR